MSARLAKKLTQAQLAQVCACPFLFERASLSMPLCAAATQTLADVAHVLCPPIVERAADTVHNTLSLQSEAIVSNGRLTDTVGGSQMINEQPKVVQEYESGKAIPNGQVLSKLSRALGVTLKKNPAPAKK